MPTYNFNPDVKTRRIEIPQPSVSEVDHKESRTKVQSSTVKEVIEEPITRKSSWGGTLQKEKRITGMIKGLSLEMDDSKEAYLMQIGQEISYDESLPMAERCLGLLASELVSK